MRLRTRHYNSKKTKYPRNTGYGFVFYAPKTHGPSGPRSYNMDFLWGFHVFAVWLERKD